MTQAQQGLIRFNFFFFGIGAFIRFLFDVLNEKVGGLILEGT